MPHSDTSTHMPMIEEIKKYVDKCKGEKIKILDCGVGSGLIGKAIKENIKDNRIVIKGIEIFEPYIAFDDIKKKINACHDAYSRIDIGNFHKFLKKTKSKTKFDIIIFGDSLEHVLPEYAESSLAYALKKSKMVIVNAPIRELPQGAVHGNDAEIHRFAWNKKNYEQFGGMCAFHNDDVGCFYWMSHWPISNTNFAPKTHGKQPQPRFNHLGELNYQ